MNTKANENKRDLFRNWRIWFQSPKRRHDRWLVFNMTVFNFQRGWDRILNPSAQNAR